MFYIPNIPYAVYLAIKAKSLLFFTTTNPVVKQSGNGSESKFETINLIPNKYKPKTKLLNCNNPILYYLESFRESQFSYPVILKPNLGFRGLLVKLVNSEKEFVEYVTNYGTVDLLLQEYIPYKNECGIFYYRLPNKAKGVVSSVTLKTFPTLTGDGFSTLKELIYKNERTKKYYELFAKVNASQINCILKKGEEKTLTVIGNHSKGTQFVNGNNLITKGLMEQIDAIMQQIPNWYYGRLDIKYNSFNELLKGENLKIIELNGIISEPTHIYDALTISYFNALKEIRKHWRILFEIAQLNRKVNHISTSSFSSFLKSLFTIKKQLKTLKKMKSTV